MEEQTESINTESGMDHSISFDEKGEEIDEERNYCEVAQEIEVNFEDVGCTSDKASQSCFVDSHPEERESDGDVEKDTSFLENNPHLPSNELPTTTEDILLGFYEAFQKTNRQLKRNDITLLKLFKEQNEILKTQTSLMKKLMEKD